VVYFKNFQGHSQNLQQVDTEDENQGPPAQSKLLDHVNLAGDVVDAMSSLAIRVPNSFQQVPRGRSLYENLISKKRQPEVEESSSTLVAMPRKGAGKKDKRGRRKNRGGLQDTIQNQSAKKQQNKHRNGKNWRKTKFNPDRANPRNGRKNRHGRKIVGKGGNKYEGRTMKKQKHGALKNRSQGQAKSSASGGRKRKGNQNKNKRSQNKKNGAKRQKKSG
jgi:hypothetical protein